MKDFIKEKRWPINLWDTKIARSNINLLQELFDEPDRAKIHNKMCYRWYKASSYSDVAKFIKEKLFK